MKKIKVIKVTSIVSLSVILIFSITAIILWQYFEYRKESNDFKMQIRIYEEFYLKDRNGLEGKTIDEIQGLINNAENQLNKCAYLLPDNTYMNLYKFISDIKQLFVSNGVIFELNNIEPIKKDFYEEIHYSVSLIGELNGIRECIDKIIEKNKLVLLNHICLLDSKNDNLPAVNLNITAYMFIEPSKSPRKKTKKKTPIEERKIKTWLPPLSIWAKAYKDKAMELKQLEKTRQDLKLKIDMFNTYKRILQKLNAIETIIKHLGNPNRRSRVSMNNLPRCTGL